jgi:hypothetical protein
MAIVLEGHLDTLKALRKFTPDLYKEMNAEIRAAMSDVIQDAKLKVPQSIPGLTQWAEPNKYLGQQNFPKYSAQVIRRGLQYSTKSSRPNRSGFVILYSLLNKTAAGAIAETAGTKNPQGQPWVGRTTDRSYGNRKQSHSANPNAGAHFIRSLNDGIGSLERVGSITKNKRGRILYAALAAKQGKTNDAIMFAIKKAVNKYNVTTQRSYGTAA